MGADVVPSPLSSQWPSASSGGGAYLPRISVSRGGEAEALLDRVVHYELDPDDADDVHEPRLVERDAGGWMDRWMDG